MTKAQPRRGELLLIFCCFAIPYFLLMSGYDTTEGLDDYRLARSIVRTGELGLPAQEGPIFDRGPDGRYYLAHEIGNPLAMTPAIAVAEFLTPALGDTLPLDRPDRLGSFLVTLNSVLFVSLLVTCAFWIWNHLLEIERETALCATVALGFGTTLFPYTKTGTDMVLTSLLILVVVAVAWSLEIRWSTMRIWLIGLLLACAFVTRPTAVLFVPGVAGWVVFLRWKRTASFAKALQSVAVIAIPLVAALIWQGWYNHLRTGDMLLPPMLLPRYTVGNTFDGASPLYAFISILVSPGKSIFVYSPVLVFGVLGFRKLWHDRRPLALFLLAVIAPYFVFHFLWKHWAGHWGWGPRLHLPLVALTFIPAALWLQSAANWRRAWNLVMVLAIFIQIAAVWNNWQFRTAVLTAQGASLHDLTWSLKSNPILDAVSNVPANLQRMYGRREWHCLEGASALHCQAANTIDVWWANLPSRSGLRIPYLSWVFVTGIALAGVSLWSRLLRAPSRVAHLSAGPLDGQSWHRSPVSQPLSDAEGQRVGKRWNADAQQQ
jgi:hypothetical protein